MTEDVKLTLVEANELSEEYYIDNVRSEVRKIFTVSDEIAILRKTVAALFKILSKIHPELLDNSEFEVYNKLVEDIKATLKEG